MVKNKSVLAKIRLNKSDLISVLIALISRNFAFTNWHFADLNYFFLCL